MKSLIKCFVILTFVIICVCPLSCRLTERGITLYNVNSYECPEIDAFSVTGSENALISFSKKVSLSGCAVTPEIGSVSCFLKDSPSGEKNFEYEVLFSQRCDAGKKYALIGIATDSIGNSLTFSLPFKGYNENIPVLEISEVHPKYASSKRKSGTVYKCEYVEFLVRSDGNLAGLELRSAHDGPDKAYEFPAIEVRRGEIIVVHLRSKTEGAVSELEENLNLSEEYYSSESARDLWAENDSSRLGDDMDVISLVNSFTEELIDGVCYSKSDSAEWKDDFMAGAAKKLNDSGLWNGSSVSDAACIDGLTPSKSIVRIAGGKSASSWEVSKAGGETPGKIDFDIMIE